MPGNGGLFRSRADGLGRGRARATAPNAHQRLVSDTSKSIHECLDQNLWDGCLGNRNLDAFRSGLPERTGRSRESLSLAMKNEPNIMSAYALRAERVLVSTPPSFRDRLLDVSIIFDQHILEERFQLAPASDDRAIAVHADDLLSVREVARALALG